MSNAVAVTRVQVRQSRPGRFCIFVGDLQIAAVQASTTAVPLMERFGEQPIAFPALRALADAVLAQASQMVASGTSLTFVLSADSWKPEKRG